MNLFVVCVEQSLLPGQTILSMIAEVRAGALAWPRMAAVWQTIPNVSQRLTPGKYVFLAQKNIVYYVYQINIFSNWGYLDSGTNLFSALWNNLLGD